MVGNNLFSIQEGRAQLAKSEINFSILAVRASMPGSRIRIQRNTK